MSECVNDRMSEFLNILRNEITTVNRQIKLKFKKNEK